MNETEEIRYPEAGWYAKDLHPISINPGNAVLVIANMQNDFCKPRGVIFAERSPQEMPEVIGAIQGLVTEARANGIPVIYLQSLRTLDEPEFTVYRHKFYVKAGSWGAAIIDELKPEPGDHVIEAWHHDPFYMSSLDRLLQNLVEEPTKTHALITGGDIGGFGFITATDFYMRDYWTVAIVDALYGDEEGREFALQGRFSADSQKSVFFSNANMVAFSKAPLPGVTGLVPGT